MVEHPCCRKPLSWRVVLALAIPVLLLFSVGENHSIWENLEPYVAGIIREMAASGDWVVPTLNGHPFLEKPPLYYFMAVWACRLVGSFDPWVMRLPSAMLAVATVFWCAFLAWRIRSVRAGVSAGFMVASSYLFFRSGHGFEVDIALIAMVSFCLGSAFLAAVGPLRRCRWVACFWASLGLVFLAKGLFGIVLVLVPLVLLVCVSRHARLAKAFLKPNWGMLLGAAIILGWVLPLWLRGGREFMVEVFVRNSFGRFTANPGMVPCTGRLGEHASPFYFYFLNTPGSVLPWTVPWIWALWTSFPRRLGPWNLRRSFIPLVFVAGLLLLSCSVAKRTIYLAPLLPLTLVHTVLWLDRSLPRWEGLQGKGLETLCRGSLILVGLMEVGVAVVMGVTRHGDWLLPAAFTLLGLLPTILWLRFLKERMTWAFSGAMIQWVVFLVLFSIAVMPRIDRQWQMVRVPFTQAKSLEAQGARVVAGRLGEAWTGYAVWELGHTLPEANDLASVERMLHAPGPVVFLVSGDYWGGSLHGRVDLAELRLFEGVMGGRRKSKLMSRTPRLLVNTAAIALLKANENRMAKLQGAGGHPGAYHQE